MFNREAPYVADGSHCRAPRANPPSSSASWQKNVIWRALQTGNTLIAHAVGAGKTFAMIGVAGEWKRQGPRQQAADRRPEPSHAAVAGFEFTRALPGGARARADEGRFHAGQPQRLMARSPTTIGMP
jgi:N12 class adenine-specific DNA methylase